MMTALDRAVLAFRAEPSDHNHAVLMAQMDLHSANVQRRNAAERVLQNMDDSLACPYPDCITYIDHNGPHEFSWGDSIPWPPESDNNEDEQS